ncbi:MAG TPA: tetratricopeptide repeat protein [Gemmatimonadales bacterium]|nr:tetratricopeptide repeat protein [Gemmatimonadales bacterium]
MRLSLCLLAPFIAASLTAQTVAQHVAEGDSASLMHPDVQLRHYQAALAIDSLSYEANWKAARAIADVAKQIQSNADSLKRRRDSLYGVGRVYAERAVRADSTKPDGHYVLSMVLGRLSRTKGSKERVRFAKIIYDEATKAVQIDSNYHLAHHVLGAWNAEVKRLSGFQRFFAKMLFGGGFMDKANWNDAVRHLETAVRLAPDHIYHRLELAEVYMDLGRYAKAREQLQAIAALPPVDVLDPQYKEDAAAYMNDIKNKKDET